MGFSVVLGVPRIEELLLEKHEDNDYKFKKYKMLFKNIIHVSI